jgi:hypothetical protein
MSIYRLKKTPMEKAIQDKERIPRTPTQEQSQAPKVALEEEQRMAKHEV